MPKGLLFHVSFDKLTTDADFSVGSGKSTFTESLAVRSAEGVKGAGLLQRRGERCSYPIAGNLDTSQGSYSVWVKPLSWDGHSGKFRHFLVVDGGKSFTLLVYLYPVGDEAVLILPEVNLGTPQEAISRAGAPVDILPRGKWTHLVATWEERMKGGAVVVVKGAWKAEGAKVEGRAVTVKVPAKKGLMLEVEGFPD
jgi:hypothetical protein